MSSSTDADENAKLSSFFSKKKKKSKAKALNANVTAREVSQQTTTTTSPAIKPARSPALNPRTPSPPNSSVKKSSKTISDLSLGGKDESPQNKASFQWAKQPKKYKNTAAQESVPKTWAEREERNREAKRLNLTSERAFPTLGADSNAGPGQTLGNMKMAKPQGVATKNVWSSLSAEDEDED